MAAPHRPALTQGVRTKKVQKFLEFVQRKYKETQSFLSSYKETPPALDSQQRPVATWPVFIISLYSHGSASAPPLFFQEPEGFPVGSYRNRNLQNVTEGSPLDLQLSLLPF